MRTHFRQWLDTTAITDPIARQQAPLLQLMLLGLIATMILGMLLVLSGSESTLRTVLDSVSALIILVCALGSLFVLRRGKFQFAVLLAALGFFPGQAVTLTNTGLDNSPVLFLFAIPITLVGLLSSRRTLLGILGLTIATVGGSVVLQPYFHAITGIIPPPPPAGIAAIIFSLIVGLLGVILDRFGRSLSVALTIARIREQELEQTQASLETTVAERTASLQNVLREVAQREAHLARTLTELQASQETIRELSAPVIPVLPGVLVAPLIGALDSTRAVMVTENILATVVQQRAHFVIVDITGVPLVDTQVAHSLVRTTEAIQLLGAQVLLVGVRPEVAQTIVALNVSLGSMVIYPDLQAAVMRLLKDGQVRSRNGRPVMV
jgi:rsbT co-antagonist protein RsbR